MANFIFGELKDKSMVQKILADLKRREITAHAQFVVHNSQEIYQLSVEREEDFPLALESFRVHLGFAPVFNPTPEEERLYKTPLGVWTRAFLIVGTAMGILLMFGQREQILAMLTISASKTDFLPEVMQGEFWRLLTPIFLHFNIMHILFNMLCLKDFGSVVEQDHGVKRYLSFFVIAGGASNLAQYFVAGPLFGGYSGVLFGLLGWLWVYSKLNPKASQVLPKSSVVLLLIWFFLCLFGLIPQIANTAHAVGLSLGMLTGIFFAFQDEKSVKVTDAIFWAVCSLLLSALTLVVEYFRFNSTFFGLQFV
jgi:GlpG protein